MSPPPITATLTFAAPHERVVDLALALQTILDGQGIGSDIAFDPEPPDYAPGISALEAAHRRLHGPPLSQGPLS